jgi:4a-hydroxytetrahydrobiopterin dehydratase
MIPLQTEDIQKELLNLPKWTLKDEKWIERRYLFKEFLQGMHFVNEIAKISEERNHHPFITIQYKVVIVSLTSWNAKGLTKLDFDMVAKFEELYTKTSAVSS